MFDPKIIAQISQQSKAEKWPFPKTFDTLKKAGVHSYEVKLENFQIQYKGDDQEWIEPTLNGIPILKVAESFNKEGVRDAIIHHIQQKTPYREFLKDIAAAGVTFYEVDMAARTVTYWGRNMKECHVENVPS